MYTFKISVRLSEYQLVKCALVLCYCSVFTNPPFLSSIALVLPEIFPTMEQMLKLLSDIQENLEKDLGLDASMAISL
ncbi:hypothetical protein P8452_52621 [Trifolium repens]|nr:hypothetical protein P8452_52621 [Trifolium repens]